MHGFKLPIFLGGSNVAESLVFSILILSRSDTSFGVFSCMNHFEMILHQHGIDVKLGN